MLHEAGHLATAPSYIRHLLTSDLDLIVPDIYEMLKDDCDPKLYYWNDLGAICWSYLACVEIGLNPLKVYRSSFLGEDRQVVENLRAGFECSIGSAYSV